MATDARKAAERAEIERARTWLWSQREPMKCVNCGEVKENWRFQVMCTQAAIQYHTCPKSNSGHVYEFTLDPDATEKMLAKYAAATIEQCAQIADKMEKESFDESYETAYRKIGAAIRAMKGAE